MVDVVALGEILIDLVSTRRNVSLYDAPAFEPKPGGAPANVAVGVQRLGGSSAFVGKVGCDDFGRGLRQLLQHEGVDTRGLLDDPDLHTTLAFVSLSDRGDPAFAIFTSASANLQTSDLDPDLIRTARIFHFGSVLLAYEPSRTTTLEALRFARANNVLVSYDINWRPAVWSDAERGLEIAKEPLPQVDIFKMNAGELALLTGEDDVRAGLENLDVPAPLVIVTMSEKGCMYRFGGKIGQQSVTPLEVVDGTGAGDAFMAAVLAGLRTPLASLDESTLARLIRRACQAGAIAVTKVGAIPSLPYADQLKDYEL
jgi:fructokinase